MQIINSFAKKKCIYLHRDLSPSASLPRYMQQPGLSVTKHKSLSLSELSPAAFQGAQEQEARVRSRAGTQTQELGHRKQGPQGVSFPTAPNTHPNVTSAPS